MVKEKDNSKSSPSCVNFQKKTSFYSQNKNTVFILSECSNEEEYFEKSFIGIFLLMN
jgi:hypothetical protein